MHEYTVIIKYPRRLAEDGLLYAALVMTPSTMSAVKEGAKQAWRAQPPKDRGKLSEWRALMVLDGFVRPVWTI